MKKKALLIFMILTALLLNDCKNAKKPPYSMNVGAYGFEKSTIINIITNEVVEKDFDDILNDKTEYLNWGWLFSFSVGINQDTKYFFISDDRCFVINDGLAYELIGNNTLKLHFPRWQGYDYNIYNVVIILSSQKTYG